VSGSECRTHRRTPSGQRTGQPLSVNRTTTRTRPNRTPSTLTNRTTSSSRSAASATNAAAPVRRPIAPESVGAASAASTASSTHGSARSSSGTRAHSPRNARPTRSPRHDPDALPRLWRARQSRPSLPVDVNAPGREPMTGPGPSITPSTRPRHGSGSPPRCGPVRRAVIGASARRVASSRITSSRWISARTSPSSGRILFRRARRVTPVGAGTRSSRTWPRRPPLTRARPAPLAPGRSPFCQIRQPAPAGPGPLRRRHEHVSIDRRRALSARRR
jgi:hypothetical protein